ncbi:MAG: hypothetical protein HY425_02610 [Candidatus Levybacteria bacterium]|nr:hypothetical protein [Candidatus Levybacteria bacterium]
MRDSVSEEGLPKRPEIPPHWKIPSIKDGEDFFEYFEVIQMYDKGAKFLSFRPVASGSQREEDAVRRLGLEGVKTHKDVVFDNNGNPKQIAEVWEKQNSTECNIEIIDGRYIGCRITHSESVPKSVEDAVEIELQDPFLEHHLLAKVVYGSMGRLEKVIFSGQFSTEGDRQQVNPDGPYATIVDFPNPRVTYRDENEKGKAKVDVSWDQDEEGNFVVAYAHLDSRKKNVITVPSGINMTEIMQLVGKEPPYEKKMLNGVETLDIPWVRIPEIIGVNLSPS